MPHPEHLQCAINGHKAILKAIEEGDKRAAQRALRAHIRQSKKDILYFGFRERKPEP
ncbi:MAG: FCD domain-containing protein [Deltaproteobacteria bacterium]|nr:FCD domain-containing protein [Deltaproteobacteria bacterium]